MFGTNNPGTKPNWHRKDNDKDELNDDCRKARNGQIQAITPIAMVFTFTNLLKPTSSGSSLRNQQHGHEQLVSSLE
ncbi:MAG: hypothetical protein WCG50_16180 [Rhodoferax sp.]|uniref:hypothetical protein n=1 Tax=Rhodoferax sp. TaxID=50421 RepID=UPI00301A5097